MTKPDIIDPEIEAMNTIFNRLSKLEKPIAEKVLLYTIERFKPELLRKPTKLDEFTDMPPLPPLNGTAKAHQ